MARVYRLDGPAKYFVAAAVLALLLGHVLVPSLLSDVVGSAGRGFSLFRTGIIEQHKTNLVGHWLGTAKGFYNSGFILAGAGERMVVRYSAEVDEGKIWLRLRRYNFANYRETAWSNTIRWSGTGTFVIDMPAAGVYDLQLSYFSFAGSIELDWTVD